MITGSNAFAMRGSRSKAMEYLRDKVEEARSTYWDYLKENEFAHDEKAMKLKSEHERAEYELYCEEYEENRSRNWK